DLPAVLLVPGGDRPPVILPVLALLAQDEREAPGALGGVVIDDVEAFELAGQLVEVVLGEALLEDRGEEFLVLGAGRLVDGASGGGLGELLGVAGLQCIQERVDRPARAAEVGRPVVAPAARIGPGTGVTGRLPAWRSARRLGSRPTGLPRSHLGPLVTGVRA